MLRNLVKHCRLAKQRPFTSTIPKLDIITDLYLAEIKAYKAPPAEKITLPTSFAAPKPPVLPEIEAAPVLKAEEALAEEKWPALEDSIDDPENYNDEWDIRTDNDNLFPQRLKPVEYH